VNSFSSLCRTVYVDTPHFASFLMIETKTYIHGSTVPSLESFQCLHVELRLTALRIPGVAEWPPNIPPPMHAEVRIVRLTSPAPFQVLIMYYQSYDPAFWNVKLKTPTRRMALPGQSSLETSFPVYDHFLQDPLRQASELPKLLPRIHCR
jgi:hypothetical protein